jgi:SAM-dependent methyltransferase
LARGDAHALPFANDTFDAAHTERVLMHVEDPAAAMAELRRVVRSGGWIVCVEPDLGGIRLDLPVQRWARGLIDGFLASIRNPAIGLTLNRIMTGAGLVDRTIDPITEVEQNYDPDVAEIFGEAANEAASQGWLSQDEARDALAALAETDIRGHYTSYATMLVVAGRVP